MVFIINLFFIHVSISDHFLALNVRVFFLKCRGISALSWSEVFCTLEICVLLHLSNIFSWEGEGRWGEV